MTDTIAIFTDGACKGNPGPGGWAAIIRTGADERELVGGAQETTNNRMEITAVIEALNSLSTPSTVTIYTDSAIVANCATGKWKRNANGDLWTLYDAAARPHRVRYEWVRGHNGHPENERADTLASQEALRRKKSSAKER